jgi:hypothetical protein
MRGNGLKGLMRLAAAAALVIGPTRAWADPLPLGGDVTPSIVNTTGVSAGASILADSGWLSSATVNGSGQAREIVVGGDTNNPYGGLDFIYQVQNTSFSSPGIKVSSIRPVCGRPTARSALLSVTIEWLAIRPDGSPWYPSMKGCNGAPTSSVIIPRCINRKSINDESRGDPSGRQGNTPVSLHGGVAQTLDAH